MAADVARSAAGQRHDLLQSHTQSLRGFLPSQQDLLQSHTQSLRGFLPSQQYLLQSHTQNLQGFLQRPGCSFGTTAWR